jgi:thymidylate kinase
VRETKLILLEGVPGSGRSTMAPTLLRRFDRQGIAATWWYEFANTFVKERAAAACATHGRWEAGG